MWIKNTDTDALFDIEDESLTGYLLKQDNFKQARAPKVEDAPPVDPPTKDEPHKE